MRIITGNRGEWAEIFILFKLLELGNFSFKKEEFKILSIYTETTKGRWEYKRNDNEIQIYLNGEIKGIFSIKIFEDKANQCLEGIYRASKNWDDIPGMSRKTKSFPIIDIEEFLKSFGCETIKAASHFKIDMEISCETVKTMEKKLLRISIKSHFGQPPDLLCVSGATFFIYEITLSQGFITEEDINRINAITDRPKYAKRIEEIENLGGIFNYHDISSKIFKNNLIKIDDDLPVILSYMVLFKWKSILPYDLSNYDKILRNINPLSYSDTSLYSKKIKKLLVACVVGMMPNLEWNEQSDIDYVIDVNKDGSFKVFNIEADDFSTYLFENNRLADADGSRYKNQHFGELYNHNGRLSFAIPLHFRYTF